MLGKNIFGSDFSADLDIKYGAGAFVCGEGNRTDRYMEGSRGEPYTKPPFPAEAGYWDQPTIVNNVETLSIIPAIIVKGADWFNKIGSETSKGTKVFAYSVARSRTSAWWKFPWASPCVEIIRRKSAAAFGHRIPKQFRPAVLPAALTL
ncbi:MAG: hypothetical protein R2864_15055 [Syntrophotaleaceae bacterium]